jgi:hypothetical protein
MQNKLHRVLRIASAVALDMFRPLRLDFGAEATADRLVERCEVGARDRLARTPTLAMYRPARQLFFVQFEVGRNAPPQ